MSLSVPESGDSGGVLSALKFDEAEDEPGGAVIGIFLERYIVMGLTAGAGK